MRQYNFFTYILTTSSKKVLYVGVTNSLERRLHEHSIGSHIGYTSLRLPIELKYAEELSSPIKAIKREKQIKNWKRTWKLELIERGNPEWIDL